MCVRRLPRGLGRVAALTVAGALLATGLAACSDRAGWSDDASVRIIAGFYPLQFVAQEVGGANVSVITLTQPGTEPHDLELSPRQVASVADADLVVYLGGFQPAVDEATQQEAAGRAFDVSDMVPLRPAIVLDTGPGEDADLPTTKGDKDPHIWLDPTRLATVGDALAERLAAIDPDRATTYRRRAQTLHARLSSLDAEFKTALAACQRHDIVVSHAAFGYLAERYGLRQIPIAGLAPDAEPSPGRLAEAAREARAHGVTTIFFETLASPAVAEAVASEVGARTAVLDPIEGLAPGSAETYVTVMQQNLTTLTTALGCR